MINFKRTTAKQPSAVGDRRDNLPDQIGVGLPAIPVITGAEYTSIVDELKVHLGQELAHATVLAEQVAFLGGTPETAVGAPPTVTDSRGALAADLDLEERQLDRYRERVAEANDAGLPDVAEALRPLLTQTQEHVRDLKAALGE